MQTNGGESAIPSNVLADELFHYFNKKYDFSCEDAKLKLQAYTRNELLIFNDQDWYVTTVRFQPRFVDAVELGLRKKVGSNDLYEHKTNDTKKDTEKETSESEPNILGSIAEELDAFPFGRSLEEWQKKMDADPDADSKVRKAILSFNRSKGQFRRYEYLGVPKDYNFITTTDNTLAMFIGYYRMVPVASAKGLVKIILANIPMCLQLDTLMRGYTCQ